MRLLLPILVISISTHVFADSTLATDQAPTSDHSQTEASASKPQVINITLTSETDGWEDSPDAPTDNPEGDLDIAMNNTEGYSDYSNIDDEDPHQDSEDTLTYEASLIQSEVETELPGKEINYDIDLHSSTHHLIDGRAKADIGKMLFKSRLMPSNEVKLSLKLKQREADDIELVAYFDLANFTMELDGSDGVLNKDHKTMLKITSTHLQAKFEEQYKDYGFPEHSLMLVQMLNYWSVSPEGYVHEKRTIISE